MNQRDTEMWANWHKFKNDGEFQVFRAWALNGSCIQQRMGLFDDVPDSWHRLKPYVEKLKNYEQANMSIIDTEYLKSLHLQDLKWTKNVKPDNGSYAYSQFKIADLFKLAWRNDEQNANRPERNDLILLRQYGHVTHIVKVLDRQSEKEEYLHEYNIYRIVEVLWVVNSDNLSDLTKAGSIFGYPEVLGYGGGNIMKLEELPTFQERWSMEGCLSAFHKHLHRELSKIN